MNKKNSSIKGKISKIFKKQTFDVTPDSDYGTVNFIKEISKPTNIKQRKKF